MGEEPSKKRLAKAYIRVLPKDEMSWDYVRLLGDETGIKVRKPQDFCRKKSHKANVLERFIEYQIDGVFYNYTQKQIYDTVMEGVLDSVVEDGDNAIIMAYGQTGSGKSLTISGLQYTYEDRGFAPRIIQDLFTILKNKPKTSVKMSYIEITKLGVVDLLQPWPNLFDMNALQKISAIENCSEEDVMQNLFAAEGKKDFSMEAGYPSHINSTILTLTIVTQIEKPSRRQKISKLHIVDLGGFDTVGHTGVLHRGAMDVGTSNLIRTQMEIMMMTFRTKNADEIYLKKRQNVFTQYLGSSLDTSSILRVVGHIKTDLEFLIITHSMLRFAQALTNVKPSQKRKEEFIETPEMTIERLSTELRQRDKERLYEAIFMSKDLSGGTNQDRLERMRNVVDEYVQSKTNEITVLNVSDANVVLQVFKEFCLAKDQRQEQIYSEHYDRGYSDGLMVGKLARRSSKSDSSSHKIGPSKKSSVRSSASVLSKQTSGGIQSDGLKQKTSRSSGIYTPQIQSSGMTRKRSKGSNSQVTTKKGSQNSKRRTGGTMSPDDGPRSAEELLPLPEILPEYEDAWAAFRSDTTSKFSQMYNNLVSADVDTREIRSAYLTEVEKLKELSQVLTIRKNELRQAEMIRDYAEEDKYDASGKLMISEMEKKCQENKAAAEEKLRDQQEIVLRNQAELRLHLNRRQELKADIKNAFEEFCKNVYTAPVVKSKAELPDIIPEDTIQTQIYEDGEDVQEAEEEEEEDKLSEEEIVKAKYEYARKFMFIEAQRKQHYIKSQRHWVTKLRD